MSKFTRLALMYLLAALFLIISNKSFAQDPTSESQVKQEAAKFFEEEDYASAYPLYSQLLSLYPEDATYNYRTGACMLFTKADKEKPIDYLELAIKKPKIDNIAYFYLGRAYHLNYKFDAAIRTYQRFQKMASSSELKKYPVAHLIDQCNDAKTLLKNMHELDVLDKKELNYADYFQAYDLSVNGGSVLVEPDDFKTKLDKKKNATSIIYLSADKNKVFFSSYGDDDKNGKDIYEVKRLPIGGFSKPVNLGTIINSPYDEDFPFYDEPTKTLYFSSKGHNSMGGYDVFKSSYNEITDTWSSPVNMDFPINTPDDDILFIADTLNQTAFFASTRFSPKGSIDVYKIKLQPHAPEYVLMRGTTFGDDGKNIAVCTITVKNFKNDQVVGVYNSSPDNGSYLMSLPNAGKFVYTVETNGHKTQSEPVIVPLETGMVTLRQKIAYEPETDKLIIKNDFESAGSDSDYLLALNYIKQKAQMEVHIDSSANNPSNNISQPLTNNTNSTQNNASTNANASTNSTETNNTTANSTQPNNSSNTNSNSTTSNNTSTNNSTNPTANSNNNPDNSNVTTNSNNPDSSNTSNGNVSTAELVKIASNDAKQDQEIAKSSKEDATKSTEYANDKLQQAQELQQQAQEITDNANNITDPAQKKDSLAKAAALKQQSQELSKKAIEAYELAAQEQNQARDKQQQADQASNYSSQLDSAQKVSNKKQALAQLQAQHDKLLQQQQQANPSVATTPTELILQQAEATKQDSTEVAHHTEDLKKEVPTLQQQSQDYIAQAQKTENPQEKLALLQQAKDLSDSKKQKEKEIKENAKLEQQLHNQYVGQVTEAHSADSIIKAAPQEVTSPQVAANDVDLKKEIANYNPQANNTNVTTNNNSTVANNSTTNPTNNSTENPTNNTSTSNSTQPNNNSTVTNNTATNPTNNSTENPANNTSTSNSTQPNNNSTVANNSTTNPTNNSTENPANNTSISNSTQPNNNTTVANNSTTNPTNSSTENPANNTSTTNSTQPNNNSTVANNTTTNPANSSTENPANNTSTTNSTQPNNNSTVANNTATNPTNNSTENPANNTSTNNTTQPNNNSTVANNTATNSTNTTGNPANNTTTNNQPQVSQTSSLYNTTPTMQSNTTTGVNTVIPTTTVQYSNPAASEANKSAAAFSVNAESATGQANATRMQARQTSDPQQAKILYQKADSLDNVATQQKLQGTEYTNNANVTQYESNQQQLTSWQNTLQRNSSDKITTANLLVQDADFYYNKSITEKHKADSNKKSYIKESYLENAKQDIATALLKQQQAENIYLSVDPNVATEAASNTIVAANVQNNPSNPNNVIVNQNTETNNTQVAQNNNPATNSNSTVNNSNTTTLPNNSENSQSTNSNTSSNTTNTSTNSTTLTSSANNPSNSSTTNPVNNNTNTANNTQATQSNPANNTTNNTSTQSASKIDSILSSPNNSTATTQNNNTQPNNNATQNNSTNSSTENPANNTAANNTTPPNNNTSATTNNNSTNNSTENPSNNTATNNTTPPNNSSSVTANNNTTQNNSTNSSTENPTNNNSTNNTTQPSNNTSANTNNNSTQNNSTNSSTENPANNTSTNNTTQQNNSSSVTANNNSTQNNSTNNSPENPANNNSTNNTTQPNSSNSVTANNSSTQNNSTNNTNSSNQPNNNTTASVQSANKIDSMLSLPNNNTSTTNNSSNSSNNNTTQNNSTNSSTENPVNNSTEANNTTTSVAPLSVDVFRESPASPYSETKPIPVNPPLPQGLIYKVQIGAFRNPIPQNLFKGINPITGDKTANGLTRYMAGIFKEYGGAKGAQDKIHQLGYRDAFIVAFLNGKRIPLSQANGTQGSNTVNNTIATNTQPDNNTTASNNTTQTQVPPNTTNAAPANAIKDVKGLFYTVQVGAFQRPVPASSLYNLKPLFSYNGPNGYIRYNCGIYSNLPQANIAKQEIILKTPIKDAFIVVYSNGERIGLNQASQLLNNGAASISTSPLLNVMPNGTKASNNPPPQISPAPNANSGNTPSNTNTVVPPAVIDTAKPATNNAQPATQNNSNPVTEPTTSNPPAASGSSIASRSLSSLNIDPAGDITVSITIHRGSITGFAKLEEEIPSGFTATEGEKQNATFKFENGKASYLWLALPNDSIFTVSYKLSALSTASAQQTITGKFLYTSNDERQEAPIAPSTITVGGSTATNVTTPVTPGNTNNNTSNTTSAPDTSKNGKVSFCVQVGAYSGNIPVDMANKLLQISSQGIHAHKEDNGITSYTVGEYTTYTSADLLKQELVKAGYTESFIVAYYQGKKISLQQAQALINK